MKASEITDAMRLCMHRAPAVRHSPLCQCPTCLKGKAIHDHHTHYPASGPEPQPPIRHEPVATEAGEASHPSGVSGRIAVSVTSYRRRLIDPDNLCPKYFVDACRYSRLIRDDTAAEIAFQVRQEKVTKKEDERTVIEIDA